MLTAEQKQQIAELAAAHDAAYAAEKARLAAETAARRDANLVHWQPVLDAARAALPAWLADGSRLEPDSHESDLSDRWVRMAQEGQPYANSTATVALYDASNDYILAIAMRRTATAWQPETYHVIDGADYGRYSYNSLEPALLRLPAEDEKRQETRAARDKVAAQEDDETSYAEYKAQEAAHAAEIKAAQEAEQERRAQFESEIADIMTAAEDCIARAEASLNPRIRNNESAPAEALLALQFSQAQSFAAIARMLDDWRKTAREYAQGNF